MTPLESSVWATLYSAGNDADNWLGKLLRQEGDFRENMEILAEDLSHQLSYYSATAYVLPHLAALCPQLLLEDQVFLVAQMGAAIAAEADRPLEPDSEADREFRQGLEGLRPLTERLVKSSETARLLQEDPEIGQQFALAALAILGDRRHAYGLYLLSGSCWQEGAAACACGWNDEGLSLAEGPGCVVPAQIGSRDGQSLKQEAVWLQGLLKLAGDEQIIPALPMVYGGGVCPNCGRREPYWDWLFRFMAEC